MQKLQHMKAEHQQQLDQLQRTVADLQRQLQQQQAPPTHLSANQRQPATSVPPTAGTYKRPYYKMNIN